MEHQYTRAVMRTSGTASTYAEVWTGSEWMEEGRALSSFGSDQLEIVDEAAKPDWAERLETVTVSDKEKI